MRISSFHPQAPLPRREADDADPVLRDGAASYTPGISERRQSVSRFLHHGLKNADSQSSPAQAVTATRVYDAFGNLTGSTGTWQGPFGYAGGFGYQEDPTGLRLLGHRYYDPSTGRFLTRDPIKDGRNWYGYGGGFGSPTTFADPEGLKKWELPVSPPSIRQPGPPGPPPVVIKPRPGGVDLEFPGGVTIGIGGNHGTITDGKIVISPPGTNVTGTVVIDGNGGRPSIEGSIRRPGISVGGKFEPWTNPTITVGIGPGYSPNPKPGIGGTITILPDRTIIVGVSVGIRW